jgi:hypothetical protein
MFVGPLWILLYVAFLVPRILCLLVDFRKICATLPMGDDNCVGSGGNVKIMKLSCLLEVLFTTSNIRAFTVRCCQLSHPWQLSLWNVLFTYPATFLFCVHLGLIVWWACLLTRCTYSVPVGTAYCHSAFYVSYNSHYRHRLYFSNPLTSADLSKPYWLT